MGQLLHVGKPTVMEAYADRSPYAAVFEDDGEYAYFYGLDTRLDERRVVDFVYVYHVDEVPNRYKPSDVDIVWSPDQMRVALLINGQPLAAFDFAARRGYCKSNFPVASTWSAAGHEWDERCVDFIPGKSQSAETTP